MRANGLAPPDFRLEKFNRRQFVATSERDFSNRLRLFQVCRVLFHATILNLTQGFGNYKMKLFLESVSSAISLCFHRLTQPSFWRLIAPLNMPNENVLAVAIERLQTQVTADAPQRDAWMKDLRKRNKDLTNLRIRLHRECDQAHQCLDELALEWARTGRLPQFRQDAEWGEKNALFRERIHRAHIFAKWLEAAGFQLYGTSEAECLKWLLTDFWKLYGQSAWLETIENPI